MTDKVKQPTIKLHFFWKNVEVGREPYKPAKALLEPQGLDMVVEIPLTNEFVDNSADILSAQLGGNDTFLPIITEKGLSLACKKLEDAMNLHSETSAKPEEEETSDDDWNDTVSWEDEGKEEPKSTSNMTNEELHVKPDEEELTWEDDNE